MKRGTSLWVVAIGIAILGVVIMTNSTSVSARRTQLIEQLDAEAHNSNTGLYKGTKRGIDSLQLVLDKEYSRAKEHDERMQILGWMSDLDQARWWNDGKGTKIEIDSIMKKIEHY